MIVTRLKCHFQADFRGPAQWGKVKKRSDQHLLGDKIYDDGGDDDEDDNDGNDDDDDDKGHLSGRGLASTSLVATLTMNRPGCLTLVGDRLVKKIIIVIVIVIIILTHLIVLIFSFPLL